MLVRFERSRDPRPGPREWQSAELPGLPGRTLLLGCPFCCGVGIVPAPVPVTSDGMVAHLVSCSLGNCPFSYQVYLDGWRELMVSIAAAATRSASAPAAPSALCQADGSGS